MDSLVRMTPDKERAKSLRGMVDVRIETIKLLSENDAEKFSSKVVEEYYEIILELITATMSADGYKTRSDITGSHLVTIDYLRKNYLQLTEEELELIDDLRKKRNRIKYYGKHNKNYYEYLQQRLPLIRQIISKLKNIVSTKTKS